MNRNPMTLTNQICLRIKYLHSLNQVRGFLRKLSSSFNRIEIRFGYQRLPRILKNVFFLAKLNFGFAESLLTNQDYIQDFFPQTEKFLVQTHSIKHFRFCPESNRPTPSHKFCEANKFSYFTRVFLQKAEQELISEEKL